MFNILKDIEKQFNISNKVIQDFKKIMEQTKIIKDKILLKSKDIENNIFNKSYFAPKINDFSNTKNKYDYTPDINYSNNESEFDIKFDDDSKFFLNGYQFLNLAQKSVFEYSDLVRELL